jgi:hypothetical protein
VSKTNGELTCFICSYSWKSKHKEYDPKVCPACGCDWRTPSLAVRFLAAWRGFQNPHLVKTTTRRARATYDTDPLATEASQNDLIIPTSFPSTLDNSVTVTDPDGLPYAARLV